MALRSRGPDEQFRLLVERGQEVGGERPLEIALDEGERFPRSGRKAGREGRGLRTQRLVGKDPVHETDAGAGLRVDPVGGEHELASPGGADEAGQQPVDAVVAGEPDAGVAGGDESGGGRETDIAGEGDGEARPCRRAGQGGDGRHRQADEYAGEGALALLELEHRFAGRALRVPAGAAAAAHALDVAAGAKGRPRPGEDERPDGRVVPQAKDHAAKRGRQLVGKGVAGFRPIESQGRHAVPQLAEQQLRSRVDCPARTAHRCCLPRCPAQLAPRRIARRTQRRRERTTKLAAALDRGRAT